MVLLSQVRSTPAEMATKRTSWMMGSGPTHAPLTGAMVYTGYEVVTPPRELIGVASSPPV